LCGFARNGAICGAGAGLAHDVFISYSSKDKAVADAVCARLEAHGVRCWIAPRDVLAGVPYGEAIIDAIHGAKVMVLVFSSSANTSGHIPKEVERAVSRGVALVPFRIENVTPAKSLDYFIGSVHWLDAMSQPLDAHLEMLAETVKRLIPGMAGIQEGMGDATAGATLPLGRQVQKDKKGKAAAYPGAYAAYGAAPPKKSHAWIWATLVVLLVIGGAGYVMYQRGDLPGLSAGDASAGISGGMMPKGTEAVIGCWHWINNVTVTIRRDGSLSVGRFSAAWRVSDPQRDIYTFIWPQPVDTVTLSPDGRTLSGVNQYGTSVSGTRIAGANGIAGSWRWFSGIAVDIDPGGTFSAGATAGSWKETDSSRGVYQLAWPTPVDVVTLAPSRNQILATNQGNRVLANRIACGGM
jgi:hypothetical protein